LEFVNVLDVNVDFANVRMNKNVILN
jgi:hypothetical protein